MFSFVLKNVLFNFDSLLNRDDHATGLVSCATCVCRVDTRRNLIILITQCLLSFSCSPFHHIVSVPIKSDHDRSSFHLQKREGIVHQVKVKVIFFFLSNACK